MTCYKPEKRIARFGYRGNVWLYEVGNGKTTKDRFAFEHPALMPELMAEDHILSWSQPGDLVFDPMCGAATTCKMALLNHRKFLGMEIHQPYWGNKNIDGGSWPGSTAPPTFYIERFRSIVRACITFLTFTNMEAPYALTHSPGQRTPGNA